MNKSMNHHHIVASHFRRSTLNGLAKKGIRLHSLTTIPDKDGTFFNGETGYGIDDNGTFKIKTFLQVLDIAKA